jgi:hypothetical protein
MKFRVLVLIVLAWVLMPTPSHCADLDISHGEVTDAGIVNAISKLPPALLPFFEPIADLWGKAKALKADGYPSWMDTEIEANEALKRVLEEKLDFLKDASPEDADKVAEALHLVYGDASLAPLQVPKRLT